MCPALELDQQRQESIQGVIYNMSPSAHYRHGEVIDNIVAHFNRYLDKSVCRAYGDKIDVYFDGDSKDYVMPDASIICDRSKFKGGKYFGIPKFIVEVLSPSTRIKDLTVKKDLYQQKGVGEYWIIDYRSKSLDIYYLIEGVYQLVSAYTLEDEEESEEYNIGTSICLREFPNMQITLEQIFE